jgi:DNA invertase Pin-like site-specific DNA recombinase
MLVMRVALYLRRSTDEIQQADSLDAQEALFRRYAAERDYEVIGAPFTDSSSGRTADRVDFQRLVEIVARGAPFGAVLVRDVTRWGRFLNVDEGAFWEFYFFTRGVRVLYVQEQFRDEADPFASIQKALRRFVAAEFSREKARLLQWGKFRSVSKGFWKGGKTPYGFARVLVNADGVRLRELHDGERKALSSDRVTLDHGNAAHVGVVRRIFSLYTEEKMTPFGIARLLNALKIPSPNGSVWHFQSVADVLANPAYSGTAAAPFKASENFPHDHSVAIPDAWPAIVHRDVWQRAQQITADRRAARTPTGLARRLRTFFQEHGHLDDKCARPRSDTLRAHFEHGSEGALAAGSRAEWAAAKETVLVSLRMRYAVTEDGDTVVLNGVLRVGFAIAAPRGHVVSGVQWRFVFDGAETQDVTIAIGLGPSLVAAAYFKFLNVRWKKKQRVLAPRLMSTANRTRTLEQVAASLNGDLFRYSSTARQQFMDAVRNLPVVNTYAVARSLGWSAATGLAIYHRLEREGVRLPPLRKKPGRRILLVCDNCGRTRSKRVGDAMQWKSSTCRRCLLLKQRRYARCDVCGLRRSLTAKRITASLSGTKSLKRCTACGGRLSKPISFAGRPRDSKGRYLAVR